MQLGSCVLFKEFQGGSNTMVSHSVFCHHARWGATHTKQIWKCIHALRGSHACSCSPLCVVAYEETCMWFIRLCPFYFWFIVTFFNSLFLLECISIFPAFQFVFSFASVTFHLNKSVMLFSITTFHNNSDSTWKQLMKASVCGPLNTWCPEGKSLTIQTPAVQCNYVQTLMMPRGLTHPIFF